VAVLELLEVLISIRLHNEILDFYDFVAPKPFEHDARHDLVDRVSCALANRGWFPNNESGRLLSFGSFPAGLYLPTADMDLVYTSDTHYHGGPPLFTVDTDRAKIKSSLHKAARKLQSAGIAIRPTVIAQAKVPIIKFQDRKTRLDVDISFENLSGVQAQGTFNEWKNKYPDMPFLVALVKQVLVMRDLNEVHTGGLGGYSIICLIMNYLQREGQADNLGGCFLDFLEYYGKKFDLRRKRIQMRPPWIVDKVSRQNPQHNRICEDQANGS
jgi:non-canonical poly(A) RNA polymerase PAPD5/7